MKTIYKNLTRLLDTTLLGILIGILTALTINIATGQKIINTFYWYSIITLVVSVICLVIMVKLRQTMDNEVNRRLGVSMDPATRWEKSCRYDEWKVRYGYLACLLICFACIGYSVAEIRQGNYSENDSSDQVRIHLEQKLDSIKQTENQVLDTEKYIRQTLSKTPTKENKPDTKAKIPAKMLAPHK